MTFRSDFYNPGSIPFRANRSVCAKIFIFDVQELRNVKYFFAALFVLSLWTIGYTVPRTNITVFLLLYTAAFSLFLILFKKVKNHHDFIFFVGVGLVARLGLMFAWPGLSDNIYRYFWDGMIGNAGISPYAFTPNELIAGGHLLSDYLVRQVYPWLSSADYYSVYPPLSQKLYQLAAFFTADNIYIAAIIIRAFTIAAEFGIIYLLMKLVPALNFPQKNVLLYALNPLIILEFTGNLHAEVIMLFFFLYGFWWMLKGRWILFSIFFSAAVLSKLTVILLFPLFLRRLGMKRFLYSAGIVSVLSVVSYGLTGLFGYPEHYLASLRLYFQSFEFNASFYYFFRWIGFHLTGHNMIYWLGPALMTAASGVFLFLYTLQYLNDKGIAIRGLFLFTVFLFASTTVHPWYVLFPVVLCLFSPYRYPIVWSFLIVFSYLSYADPPIDELIWIVFTEYMLLGVVMLIEFKIIPGKNYLRFFEI